jgi:hypothetical protein
MGKSVSRCIAVTTVTDGENAVRLGLSNQHEDFLYDDAGNNKTGNVTSQATVYDGASPVSASDVTWAIVSDSSKTYGVPTSGANVPTLVNGLLTVKALTANTAKVTIKATYPKTNGQDYFAEFTANKRTQDVYNLDIQPNIISYNTSNTFSPTTITIKAHRVSIDGSQADITTFNSDLLYLAAYLKSGSTFAWHTIGTNGTISPAQTVCDANDNILIELRKVKSGATYSVSNPSTYTVEDFQTVDVQKYHNGNDSTVPGPSGYTVSIKPVGVTINQTGSTFDVDSNTPYYVDVVITKGDSSTDLVTNMSITANRCSKDSSKAIAVANVVTETISGVSKKRLKVIGVGSDAFTQKYTQGYIDLDITAEGKTFAVVIPVAVNYIATYVEKSFNDHKETFAQEIITTIDKSGNFVANDSTYEQFKSATEEKNQWVSEVNTPAATVKNYNTRISTAEQNISTVKSEVESTNILQWNDIEDASDGTILTDDSCYWILITIISYCLWYRKTSCVNTIT